MRRPLDHQHLFSLLPPPLTMALVQILAGLGVPDSRISYEYFSL